MNIESYLKDKNTPEEIKGLIKFCQEFASVQDLKIKRTCLGDDPPHVICFGIDMTYQAGLSKQNLSDHITSA